MDKVGRDQFVIRHRDTTEVLWNDGKRGRVEEAYKREFWTESFVQWSPQGTMIATMHRQGVALWGGPTFERIARIAHANVRFIDFSPNEKFVCTYTSHEPRGPHETFTVNLNVYDVRANKLARPFDGPAEKYAVGAQAGPGGALKWPVFKWAGGKEDKYFARLGKNKDRKAVLCVYQTSTMDMLPALVGGVEKPAPISVDNLYDFEWSPSEPLMACYMTEQLNTPAKIMLLRIPEKTEARQKNLFDVNGEDGGWGREQRCMQR